MSDKITSRALWGASVLLVAFILMQGCNTSIPETGSGLPDPQEQPDAVPISEARKTAARLMAPGSFILFDLLQQDLLDCTERRCDPLGFDPVVPPDPMCPLANTRWTSRIGGPVILNPASFLVSEYDWLWTDPSGETEIALGVRGTSPDPFFSHLEFNLRAVNPRANGHVPGTHYGPLQALYPSNDDVTANRTLINPLGGDVAILVQGINFAGAPVGNTSAFMNFLGPTGWLVFLRDNAFQSGRFFAISGALQGGPRAFADTPSLADDGAFQSVQVNGDNFDALSQPAGQMDPPNFQVCLGAPAVGKPYAFFDIPNIDEFGFASPGESGFLFVMRQEAFAPGGSLVNVVVNPNGPVLPIQPGNQIQAPISGYNEPGVPPIVAPDEDNFTGVGAPGIHEMAISVFFIHG